MRTYEDCPLRSHPPIPDCDRSDISKSFQGWCSGQQPRNHRIRSKIILMGRFVSSVARTASACDGCGLSWSSFVWDWVFVSVVGRGLPLAVISCCNASLRSNSSCVCDCFVQELVLQLRFGCSLSGRDACSQKIKCPPVGSVGVSFAFRRLLVCLWWSGAGAVVTGCLRARSCILARSDSLGVSVVVVH